MQIDIWDRWLAIAFRQTREAEKAHARLLQAVEEDDEANMSVALEDEFSAGVMAIAASAFAVDAMYDSVKQRTPKPPPVPQTCRRPTRYKHVAEMLKRGFKSSEQRQKEIRAFLKRLYKWRDDAVHPPAGWNKPVLYKELDRLVERRFVAFSAANARTAFEEISKLFRELVESPRPNLDELVEWTASAKTLLADAVGGAGRNSR